MSISRSENPAKKSVLQREISLPVINIKRIAQGFIKAFPKKPLDTILLICFTATALGELFGRDYGWKWYCLVLLVLAAYVVKGIVEPEPIISGVTLDKQDERINSE